jgi:hypothetical protein
VGSAALYLRPPSSCKAHPAPPLGRPAAALLYSSECQRLFCLRALLSRIAAAVGSLAGFHCDPELESGGGQSRLCRLLPCSWGGSSLPSPPACGSAASAVRMQQLLCASPAGILVAAVGWPAGIGAALDLESGRGQLSPLPMAAFQPRGRPLSPARLPAAVLLLPSMCYSVSCACIGMQPGHGQASSVWVGSFLLSAVTRGTAVGRGQSLRRLPPWPPASSGGHQPPSSMPLWHTHHLLLLLNSRPPLSPAPTPQKTHPCWRLGCPTL